MLDRISFSDATTALPIQRQVSSASQALSKSMERLSSGLRINRAADDAAGKAVSETLSAQVRGLAQANANAQDAVNLIQTADGGLSEAADILRRMRELVLQAGNDTYTQSDRAKIQAEIEQLKQSLTDIAQKTQFNGRNLLDGSIAGSRFTEPGGAYIISNPIVGLPGNQGRMVSNFAISNAGATQDLDFFMTLYDPGIPSYFPWSTKPAMAVSITTSSGWSWGEQALNEFFIPGLTMEYTSVFGQNLGWGFDIVWGNSYIYPTVDAGKTFQLHMDHTLGSNTIDHSLQFQVGSNAGQTVSVAARSVSAKDLLLEGLTVLGPTEADSHERTDLALPVIDNALNRINTDRSRLGAAQNRLEQSVQTTAEAGIAQTASLSGIQDADMAAESTAFTRVQVLQQASIGLLAQANVIPDMAMKLLESGKEVLTGTT